MLNRIFGSRKTDLADKGFNIENLTYIPSEFKSYDFKSIRVRDLSIGQTETLSLLRGEPNILKIAELYSPCFVDLTPDEVLQLLYMDFITCIHFINHISFGTYDNSFTYNCTECGKPHKVSYNLYDIGFQKVTKSYKENEIKAKDITFSIRPFTVQRVAELMEAGKMDKDVAFLATSVDSSKYAGKVELAPDDLDERISWITSFSNSVKDELVKGIWLRYPKALPLKAKFRCGKEITYFPELTLKGLPYFTK